MDMWAEGGCYEQRDTSSTEFKREVRVLLVDHDQQHLYSLAALFTSCSFNVTAVERASTALQILTERQAEFDLLIADVYLADVGALTLIRLAANMGLQVMLMTGNSLHSMMEGALSSGALLLLQKPMSREVLLYVFQTVRREKMRKERESISLDGEMRGEINRCQVKESEGKGNMDEAQSTGINYVPRKRGRKPMKRDDGYECGGFGNGTKLKKKTCTEWTEELHAKFMDAVQQLGEGRCYPTNIVEVMDVPGLTRMQVASHLQKCRNDKWRNMERKSKRSSNSHPTVPNQVNDNGVIPKSNNKRFGSMPFSDNGNSIDPNLVQPSKDLNDTNATTEHVDPISPPQPQNPPQPSPQNPPQPFDTHPLFSNNTQIPNVEQNRNHGPLGSLSMSDNASKNVTGSLSSHSMSDNALGNVRGSPLNLSVSDNVSKIVMGPPGNPSMSQNASKNVTESPDSLSMSDNASKDMTMGMVNFDNPLEMSNLNGVHEKFVAPMAMTNQTCYVPVSPNLSMATARIDHHANSSSYQKVFQSSDDFFDSNREMGEYIQNFSGHPDGSMIYNQSIRTKQVDFDFDPGFPDQFSTGPNGQGPGQWSNSGGTSNFLGE